MTLKDILSKAPPESLSALLGQVRTAELQDLSKLRKCSVHILRNHTVEPLVPHLKYHLLRSELRPKISIGTYGVVQQELMDPQSELRRQNPDFVVISLMAELLDRSYGLPGWDASRMIEELGQIYELALRETTSILLAPTFIPPFFQDLQEDRLNGGLAAQVERLNQFTLELSQAQPGRFFQIDLSRLLRIVGERDGLDYRYWYLSKSPFKPALLDLYAKEIAKRARPLKGKARKCLVLDCDNTLWGGIIGEDGMKGIQLDSDQYPGKAFYDFQKSVLQLHSQGVLITLCSKNNEREVFEVLDNHPHGLIKRKHLAGWRINWEQKDNNIAELAAELNLGLDSLVFVDDNAVECEWVSASLPEVQVLQVPAELSQYPNLILRENCFSSLALTEEDRRRTVLYQEENARKNEQKKHGNVEEYLASLELEISVSPARSEELVRVAQLTQKTNQFNLTTKRYSEAEISTLAAGEDSAVYTLKVKDKFGDYGLTGVLIAVRSANSTDIDSLLLSCRILGRKIELAFVQRCLAELSDRWSSAIFNASYLASPKNSQVADFWSAIGFKETEQSATGKAYRLSRQDEQPKKVNFIKFKEDGATHG